jgi:hypothetical protein
MCFMCDSWANYILLSVKLIALLLPNMDIIPVVELCNVFVVIGPRMSHADRCTFFYLFLDLILGNR